MSKAWGKATAQPSSIDPQRVYGFQLTPFNYSYAERDVMLYAASIGFGLDSPVTEDVLQSTYESNENFGIFPSFAVLPPFRCITDVVTIPGLTFNPMMLLHGETEFFLHKKCSVIPTEGVLTTNGIISTLQNKKSGCSIEITAKTYHNKDLFCTNIMTLFIRGGPQFQSPHNPLP